MKTVLMIAALSLISSGALAQPSQSQGGGQAGTNGTADTTMSTGSTNPNAMRDNGTSGMATGRVGETTGSTETRPMTAPSNTTGSTERTR